MPQLLDRQTALLAYLTSPAAIFGGGRGRIDAHLAGVDRSRLHLEARFSHDKRMEKIQGALPKTFELLGPSLGRVLRDFAAACPPTDIGRLHNARQFYEFLRRRWRRKPPRRPYLADVMACELALTEARRFAEDNPAPRAPASAERPDRIRRRPGVVLVRCRYDVRPVFEGGAGRVIQRRTNLAIAVRAGAEGPEVSELAPPVFDLLAALEQPLKRAEIGGGAAVDGLIDALAESGLVEPCD